MVRKRRSAWQPPSYAPHLFSQSFLSWRCQLGFFCLSGQLLGFSSGGAKLKHRSWESNVDAPKSFLIVDDLARNNKGLWQHTASWQILELKPLNHKHPHTHTQLLNFSWGQFSLIALPCCRKVAYGKWPNQWLLMSATAVCVYVCVCG